MKPAQRAARIALAATLALLLAIALLSLRSLSRLEDPAWLNRAEIVQARQETWIALLALTLACIVGTVLALVSDRAMRREIEERLRVEEQRRRLFELSNDMMSILAPDGHREVNRSWERILGYTPEEVRGMKVPQMVHPDEVDEVVDLLARVRRGERVTAHEHRFLTKGGEYRWLAWSSVFDEERGLLYSTARDVTEHRHHAQRLEALTRELARSNRELQEFATVASHDLQEPLRKIRTFGDRLQANSSGLDEQGRDYLTRMQAAAARMQRLIEDLLSFSRIAGKPPAFQSVDLEALARDAAADLEARAAETSARIEIGALPAIKADPTQMRQLFQNLIGNALKFHKPGVPPVVRVSGSVHEASPPVCRIEVADEGIGFDEKYVERIFAVFQRLHGRGEYEGTGMGLAICRRIAERHGGSITAKSTPGEGATFITTLPVDPPSPEAS